MIVDFFFIVLMCIPLWGFICFSQTISDMRKIIGSRIYIMTKAINIIQEKVKLISKDSSDEEIKTLFNFTVVCEEMYSEMRDSFSEIYKKGSGWEHFKKRLLLQNPYILYPKNQLIIAKYKKILEETK